ncbi:MULTISPECIES: hypothetical protein [Rhodopirellula]|uniref:hypothetical protein n=1 Tax=Rhodopirellula sp. MGV TaxID=2023130 RepID=UPI000B97AC8D|nr:hypothetical protein CGZ80_03260 [Rhodopirellula sp. MGV]PNY38896.1 hypothetical protein C2E31_01315 [Rhodopirellula baltica]
MLFTLSLMSVNGCGTKTGSDLVDGESQQIDSVYVVTEEPADAIPVGIAKESVEGEQYLSLVGTIGGSAKPFVDGIAAFTIVDPKVPSCAGEEGCPTPWDYCCTQNQVKDNIATVKIVDSEGVPVASDARGLLGVKELSTVVVSGTVKRDDTGNLSIAATQVFVKPSK